MLRATWTGVSIEEIAGAVQLASGTVRDSLSNAVGKLHGESRYAAAHRAAATIRLPG